MRAVMAVLLALALSICSFLLHNMVSRPFWFTLRIYFSLGYLVAAWFVPADWLPDWLPTSKDTRCVCTFTQRRSLTLICLTLEGCTLNGAGCARLPGSHPRPFWACLPAYARSGVLIRAFYFLVSSRLAT